MGETTLQDRRLAAEEHKSNKYTALKETALAFIDAQRRNPALSTGMDVDALRNLVTKSFSHSFGPTYSVSHAPRLQGPFTVEKFIEHVSAMIPQLESWDIDPTGIVVDEVGSSVVVRASYMMHVGGERIENDIVWWLELEEGLKGSETGEGNEVGGGWKVRKSTEIVDMGAAARIKELMMRGKGQAERKDSAAVAG
jgi:hypothetical protein